MSEIALGTGSIQYPITAVLGKRGSGKTLFLTYIAYAAHQQGLNVFANFTLYNIPYIQVSGEDIGDKADFIKDGVLLLDEIREEADSYKPFSASSEQVSTFAAQSRKKRISLFYAAQDMKQATARLRRLTDLVITMTSTPYEHYHQFRVVEKSVGNAEIKPWTYFYGKPFYNLYDTNEIITSGKE